MLGDVNKLFVFKSLLTTPSNVLPLHLKQTFPPIIWIFTEGEGDGIKSRLPFKNFSTLPEKKPFSSRGFIFTKVEKILKGSLDSIPSPSPSVKIQIMGGKVCLRCKGKTLLGVVNKLLKTKSLLTSPSNVLPYHFK